MSEMYKSLRFRNVNTVTELRTPAVDTDAFRLVDFREGATNITNQFQTADEEEAQAREDGDRTLQANFQASIAQMEAAYRAADIAEAQARQADVQSLVNGFSPKDPVFTLLNAPVALSGLTVNTPSFSGAIPAGSRVLVIGQGGDAATADVANGIYIAANGAWSRSTDADEGDELVRSILVPVENGNDAFRNTVYFLAQPQIFQDTAIGTTALRFARWLGADTVRADESTVHREGNVFSAILNAAQLIAGATGIELAPAFIAELRDLGQATGLLDTNQIRNLMGYITAITLNSFAAPTAPVAYADQRITGLADPTAPQDGVNQRTLTAAVNSLNGAINNLNQTLTAAIQDQEDKDGYFPLSGGDIVDGDLVVNVTHNKNSFKIMKEVLDTTNGETIDTDFVRVMNNGANSCQVIFRGHTTIPAGQFALMVHRVAD